MVGTSVVEIIEKHCLWLNNNQEGERANLRCADLSCADLSNVNLICADLMGANLTGANLMNANLSHVDLMDANLTDANLHNANLHNADLTNTNLTNANLKGVNGNLSTIKSIFIEAYPVTYTAEYLQIGSHYHSISEWWEFDNKRLLEIGGEAILDFWLKWKYPIKQIIDISPATPTVPGYKRENAEVA